MSFGEEEEATEDIDERRRNRQAYEYLCRLLEVRNWLAECLNDDSIASVTELENNFRNGVVLARLGHTFAPEIVSAKQIFDVNQEIYHEKENVPIYKHTDNIMHWRRAMESVGLPEIVIPETVDVFEGRNIKTVFCLYALAFLLYRLRKAPKLKNLAGKAEFTNDEMNEMKDQLKDTHLPEFGDVGGLLASPVSDKQSQELAIRNINQAIDDKDEDNLLVSLQETHAGLIYVEKELKSSYLTRLTDKKQAEDNNLLTKKTIQNTILDTNNEYALAQMHILFADEVVDSERLLLLFDYLQFEQIRESALSLYVKLLREKILANNGEPLTRKQVLETIEVANALAEVKVATQQGSSKDVLKALRNNVLQLDPRDENSFLYYNRLLYNYEKSLPEFFLGRNELQSIIYEFEDISSEHRDVLELNESIAKKDEESMELILRRLAGELFIDQNTEYYIKRLEQQKNVDNVEGLKELIIDLNDKVHTAFVEAEHLVRLNTSMHKKDASGTRLNLIALTSSNRSKDYKVERLHWYINRLLQEARHRNEAFQKEPSQQYWLTYEFTYGNVYIETSEHTRSTKLQTPEDPQFLTWSEVEKALREENENFELYYTENHEKVKMAQEVVRRKLQYQQRRAELMRSKEEELAAKTIQENYKKYRQRKDIDELRTTECPSLTLVRRCMDPLQERENELELALEQFKSNVWEMRVRNQELDSDLQKLDTKISHLVANRLNLEEVIAHKDKITKDNSNGHFKHRPASIRKKAKDQQETLEQLMFHLQAEPKYLANLVQSTQRRESPEVNLFHDVIAPIFGLVTVKREEFLLVRLLCEVILRNVEKMENLTDFTKTSDGVFIENVLCSNILLEASNKNICNSLSDVLKRFCSSDEKSIFNLDPMNIYQSLYGKEASDIHVAVEDQEVSKILESSMDFLSNWSRDMVTDLTAGFSLPASVLYTTLYLEDILRRQLPTKAITEVRRFVSEFVYKTYIKHYLLDKEALKKAVDGKVNEDVGPKLSTIVQFIEFGIANKGYGNSKWFLSRLNKTIHNIHEDFNKFMDKQLLNVKLDDIYSMNEFTHFDPSHRPSLSFIDRQLAALIKYLKDNSPVLVPGTSAHLHTLISKASAPTVDADKTIVLSLHPASAYAQQYRSENQELFVRTKKYVVDLILSNCVGEDIPELISTKPTTEQEETHSNLKSENLNLPQLTIEQKQAEIGTGLEELEKSGRVSKDDKYQSIVTDIANDIRQATRRKKEKAELKSSLEGTMKYLKLQRDELNARLATYEEYLDTCLENLPRTSKRMSIRANTKAAEKIQKQRLSIVGPQSVKSSAEKLFRKGVLVNLTVPNYDSVKKMSKLTVEISVTEQKGLFHINILDGKTLLKELKMDFSDLLTCEAVQEKMLIGNTVEVDVVQLKQYINKKFYNV